MVTRFGRFCRNIRMDNGELLYDMAKRLGVSSAFLSSVENGRAKPPVGWGRILASEYQLNAEQICELKECIKEARETVIRVVDLSQNDRDMMFAFARQLDGLSDEEKDKWKKMLRM